MNVSPLTTDKASIALQGSGTEPTTDDRSVTLPPLPFTDGLEVGTAGLVLEVVDLVVDDVLLVEDGVDRDGVW